MSIRSGLAAQIGFGDETTYGTYATPTRFLEFESESLALQQEYAESPGLRATNRVQRTDRVRVNTLGASGNVLFPAVQSKGFGLVLKHMVGKAGVITTTSGGTNAKDHTYTLGDPYGLSTTWQVGRPDVSGTVQPFSYPGTKVTGWTLSNQSGGYVSLGVDLFSQAEDRDIALASASYSSGTVEDLFYADGTLNVASGAVSVMDVSISGATAVNTDRRFIRSSTLVKEPLIAGMYEITGSMTMEFESLTQYELFTDNTVGQLDVTWSAPTAIESTIKPSLKVTLPKVQFRGTTPNVSGPGIVTLTCPFKALYDGTNEPITIVYVSSDATD